MKEEKYINSQILLFMEKESATCWMTLHWKLHTHTPDTHRHTQTHTLTVHQVQQRVSVVVKGRVIEMIIIH